MDKQEVYKIAVNTRQTEIQLFWQRSNYFMVLNIAIAVGFFALKNESYDPVLAGLGAPVLAALGAAVSVLWFLINLGGKFWQVFWEEAAARLERECCPEARLFAASTEFIRQEVENGLLNNSDGRFREWLDTLILKKLSVTYLMTFLSFIFVLFWAGAFTLSILIK